jgi:hypothetical protein
MQLNRKASITHLMGPAVAALALFSLAAAADLVGVYRGAEGEFTIEYRDDEHIRMERGSAEAGFLLARPEGSYMVMRTDEGWHYMGPESPLESDAGSDPDFELESTGRSETVAGIEGVVYRYNGAGFGPEDQQEMVLTNHPQVVRLTRAFMTLIAGPDAAKEWADEMADIAHKGLLRNEGFELLRIEDSQQLPASRFELPPDARPMTGDG